MWAALRAALAYTAQRQVFGAALDSYPLTLAKLARMGARLLACRRLTYAVAGRLEEEGYIQRYETRLSAPRMGLTVVAVIHVSMERGHVRELHHFKDLVGSLDDVLECYSVTGDFDYMLKVTARDLPSLSRFLMDTLMKLPGVAAVRSSVCMDEIKCTSALPLPG